MTRDTTKPSKKIAAAAQAIRKRALAFPETVEDMPWGHSAFKVKKKIFLVMVADGTGISFSAKLPKSGKSALMLPFAEPTGYGLGKSGWVSAQFGPTDDVPLGLVQDWMTESYQAIAPKKLWAVAEGDAQTKTKKVAAKPQRAKVKAKTSARRWT